MPLVSSPVSTDKPRIAFGGGGKGPTPVNPGGGGGGGRGDQHPDYGEKLRQYRLGMAIALAAVFMLFVSFTVAFVLRQQVGRWDVNLQAYVRDWKPVTIPTGVLFINTLILLGSGFTLEKARRQAFRDVALAGAATIPGVKVHEGRTVPWLGLTIALGCLFLAGQVIAWRVMGLHGYFLAGTPDSSFFYVLTAMHGIHLIGGILALLYAAAIVRQRSGVIRKRVVLEVTAWYWHSMAFLWLYVFGLLKLVER